MIVTFLFSWNCLGDEWRRLGREKNCSGGQRDMISLVFCPKDKAILVSLCDEVGV